MQRLLGPAQALDEWDDPFVIDGRRLSPDAVIEGLRPVMTEARVERLENVVARRTYTVVPVIEGLVNTGNVSAVMRSAEGLGYQALHVVRGQNERFKKSERTSQGAEKWMDLVRWDDPAACVGHLQKEGYTVLAMHLDDDAVPLARVDFTEPTALVLGNEDQGISPAMQEAVDGTCAIPMSGFTQSFNVSVAAAIALHQARQDRLERQGHHADLSSDEQAALMARFCLRSVNNAEAVLRRQMQDGAI